MKKVFLFAFAAVLFAVKINAQTVYTLKSVTLPNGLTVQPGQWVDGSLIGATSGKPYLYMGYDGDHPSFNIQCINCTEQNQAGNTNATVVVPAPVVNSYTTVNAVDKEYNNAMYGETVRHNKVVERQGRIGLITGTLLQAAIGASDQVGLWKGKYQSNLSTTTNVFTTNGTAPNVPTWNNTPAPGPNRPTDWLPVQGTTQVPPFIPSWNNTPAPAGNPIIPNQGNPGPGDWFPVF